MADVSKQEVKALSMIKTLDDPDRLRAMMANARRLGSEFVERAAFQRLCYVQPAAQPGTVEHDVWRSIHALEQMLLEERGKTVRLSRTRQKITKDGEIKTASDLSMKTEAAEGFSMLMERGHPELTFESVVLRHPAAFKQPALNAAADRLSSAGIDPKSISHGAT